MKFHKDTVYDSVHWNAAREGVEDNEELAMLKDAIKTSKNPVWKLQAQKVLDHAVAAVTGSWTGDYKWQDENDPDLADLQLQQVRDVLVTKRWKGTLLYLPQIIYL